MIIDEITNLTEKWYHLIGKDHHKDRDCHWYIETKWSYGCEPTYSVKHWGYILDDIVEGCESYDKALTTLRDLLKEKIEEEKRQQEEETAGDGWK
jgi:hypothetical protein